MSSIAHIIKTYLPIENACVMYIGANTGQELEDFFSHVKSGNIYCFEPLKRTISFLEITIMNLKLAYPESDIDVEIIQKAVCNKDGDIIIHHNPQDPAHQSATIMPLPEGEKSWTQHHIEEILTPAIKLDTFIQDRQIEKIDLIYADVEGAQAPLLDGATNALQISEHLYIETQSLWGGLSYTDIVNRLDGQFGVELKLGVDTFFKKQTLKG